MKEVAICMGCNNELDARDRELIQGRIAGKMMGKGVSPALALELAADYVEPDRRKAIQAGGDALAGYWARRAKAEHALGLPPPVLLQERVEEWVSRLRDMYTARIPGQQMQLFSGYRTHGLAKIPEMPPGHPHRGGGPSRDIPAQTAQGQTLMEVFEEEERKRGIPPGEPVDVVKRLSMLGPGAVGVLAEIARRHFQGETAAYEAVMEMERAANPPHYMQAPSAKVRIEETLPDGRVKGTIGAVPFDLDPNPALKPEVVINYAPGDLERVKETVARELGVGAAEWEEVRLTPDATIRVSPEEAAEIAATMGEAGPLKWDAETEAKFDAIRKQDCFVSALTPLQPRLPLPEPETGTIREMPTITPAMVVTGAAAPGSGDVWGKDRHEFLRSLCPLTPTPSQRVMLDAHALENKQPELWLSGQEKSGRSTALLMGMLQYGYQQGYQGIVLDRRGGGLRDTLATWLANAGMAWLSKLGWDFRLPTGAMLAVYEWAVGQSVKDLRGLIGNSTFVGIDGLDEVSEDEHIGAHDLMLGLMSTPTRTDGTETLVVPGLIVCAAPKILDLPEWAGPLVTGRSSIIQVIQASPKGLPGG